MSVRRKVELFQSGGTGEVVQSRGKIELFRSGGTVEKNYFSQNFISRVELVPS